MVDLSSIHEKKDFVEVSKNLALATD